VNINIFTLIGQMISFALLVCHDEVRVAAVMRAMEERQKLIADGLAAGERGRHEFDLAQQKPPRPARGARARGRYAHRGRQTCRPDLDEAKTQAKEEAGGWLPQCVLSGARAQCGTRAAASGRGRAGSGRCRKDPRKEIDAKAHAKLSTCGEGL